MYYTGIINNFINNAMIIRPAHRKSGAPGILPIFPWPNLDVCPTSRYIRYTIWSYGRQLDVERAERLLIFYGGRNEDADCSGEK